MNILNTIKQKASDIASEYLTTSQNISKDILSYRTLLQDRAKFRQAGGPNTSDFNAWDTPGHYFFRVFFHFYNGTAGSTDSVQDIGDETMSGLLGPSWNAMTDNSNEDAEDIVLGDPEWEANGDKAQELAPWDYNTAFSYLVMNDEKERADMLYHFINLLSNINSESPWYWQKITGIDEAIARTQASTEFSFKERQKISIECLPDAADNRIGTLIDLYRAIVWSWQKKCEIVPANLRKFDMSIVIFSSPLQSIHHPIEKPELTDALGIVEDYVTLENYDYATLDPDQSGNFYLSSFKILEFHNCEIDYSTARYGYENIENETGFEQKYKLDIFYDDVFETRYNENMKKMFGDIVKVDTLTYIYRSLASVQETDNSPKYSNFDQSNGGMRTYNKTADVLDADYRATRRLQSSISSQLLDMGTGWIANKANNLILGNLFGFSLQNLGTQVNQLLEGQVGSTINNIRQYVQGNYNGLTVGKINSNITEDSVGGGISKITNTANMFDSKQQVSQTVLNLGNMFTMRTLANT